MSPSYANPTTTIILYETLDVSIIELETKCSLKVTWTGISCLPPTEDKYDTRFSWPSLETGGIGKIRIFEISKDGKTRKEFTGSEMIGNIPEPVDLYAEVR